MLSDFQSLNTFITPKKWTSPLAFFFLLFCCCWSPYLRFPVMPPSFQNLRMNSRRTLPQLMWALEPQSRAIRRWAVVVVLVPAIPVLVILVLAILVRVILVRVIPVLVTLVLVVPAVPAAAVRNRLDLAPAWAQPSRPNLRAIATWNRPPCPLIPAIPVGHGLRWVAVPRVGL